MVADLNNLVRLTKAQAKPVAKMMGRAFHDNPLSVYFLPDESQRKSKLPYILQFMIRYGLLYGEVYAISPNLEGAAVWLPSEKAHMTLWSVIRSGYFTMVLKAGTKSVSKFKSFGDYVSSIHKRQVPFPHEYLFLLGVDPVHQGKGYGSTLLKAMFARLDKEHLPCYLETQSEKNIPIYQHHGFKVVEEGIVPGTEVTNWSMLREKADVNKSH